MDASQIILCSILCMSLMVALSESAPLEHSLTKRHAFEGITQGNNNLFLNFLMKKKNTVTRRWILFTCTGTARKAYVLLTMPLWTCKLWNYDDLFYSVHFSFLTEIVKSRRRRGINRNVRIRQMYICLALIRDISDHRNFNDSYLPSYCRPLYCAQLARSGVQSYPSFCTNNVSITVIQK